MRSKCLPDFAALSLFAAASTILWKIRVEPPWTIKFRAHGNLDQFTYFEPLYRLTAQRLAAGRLPLWNPWQLAGTPLVATPQSGVFYPPNLLYLALETHQAMRVLSFSHVVLAGWLAYALARTLGAIRPAAVLGGLAYAWSSFVICRHMCPPCIAVLAWSPLPLIGIAWIHRQRFVAGCSCLAAGIALEIVTGYFPFAFFGLQITFAYAAWNVVGTWLGGERRGSLVQLAWLLGGVSLALAIACAQWLPTLELTQLSTRSPEGLTRAQIEPKGAWREARMRIGLTPSPFGGGYAGVLVLMLAPVALIARRYRAQACFFAALATVVAILSLGSATPLFDLYLKLPGAKLFRDPSRFMCLFELCGAVLAALGLDVLLTRPTESGAWSKRVKIALPLGLGLVGIASAAMSQPPWAIAASIAVITAALYLPARWTGYLAATCIAVLFADVALIPPNTERQVWRDGAREPLRALERPYQALASEFGLKRILVPRDRRYPAATYPRGPSRYGLYNFGDYEPQSLRRYADYAAFVQHGLLYDPRGGTQAFSGNFDFDQPIVHRRLLAAAGVHAIATVEASRTKPPALALDRIAGALPRAYLVHGVRAAETADATLRAIADGTLQLNAEVILESPPADALAPAAGPVLGETVRVANYEAERVVIEAGLERPGTLVLLDADYPGWRVRVDGQPARIFNANYLFRGVVLQPGKHRVEFEYKPASVSWGIFISMCGLALLALLPLAARRMPSKHPVRARADQIGAVITLDSPRR